MNWTRNLKELRHAVNALQYLLLLHCLFVCHDSNGTSTVVEFLEYILCLTDLCRVTATIK